MSACTIDPPALVAITNPPQETTAVLRHLAHELRQPLSTIESIAYCLEMVLSRTGERDEQKALGHVEKLRGLVEQANNTLADAIYFFQASTPRLVTLDLNEIIRCCLEDFSNARECRFDLDLSTETPHVVLDQGQAEHMVRNLATVAAASSADSRVWVRTSLRQHVVDLEFGCSASHLSQNELATITEPFSPHLPSGLGLALASVGRIAEMHGGLLRTHAHPDGGFSLRVALPLS